MTDSLLLMLLLIGIAAYLIAGLMPFTLDLAREPRVYLGFKAPFNATLNYLCFVPLGVLIANLSFVERPLLAAGLVCGALSLMVESLQIFIPGRFSTLSDWVLNTSGALTGAWLVARL